MRLCQEQAPLYPRRQREGRGAPSPAVGAAQGPEKRESCGHTERSPQDKFPVRGQPPCGSTGHSRRGPYGTPPGVLLVSPPPLFETFVLCWDIIAM